MCPLDTSLPYILNKICTQHLIFNSSNIFRIASKVVILVGTNGRRSLFSIIPIAFNMAFTPAGLPSTKSNLNNSANLWWMVSAFE
jgi:hypothetical protein